MPLGRWKRADGKMIVLSAERARGGLEPGWDRETDRDKDRQGETNKYVI